MIMVDKISVLDIYTEWRSTPIQAILPISNYVATSCIDYQLNYALPEEKLGTENQKYI